MLSDGYKIRNQFGVHFLSFAVVEWIDVFTRTEYQNIILDNLRHCQLKRGLILNAWCLMSNHIHLVGSAKNGNLSALLRDFKSFTSGKLVKAISKILKKAGKIGCCPSFETAVGQTAATITSSSGARITSPKNVTLRRSLCKK